MHSKLRRTKKSLSQKNWLGRSSFLLMVPVIFISLVQCTIENPESNKPSNNAVQLTAQPARLDVQENSQRDLTPQTAQTELAEHKNPTPKPAEPCATPPIESKIEVDISEQQLYLFCRYDNGNKEVKIYPVSTSKYGIGNQAGSNKTPLGLHYIKNKIGDGAPLGMIFKARQPMGRVAKINAEVGDFVTTRIMWLKGLEPGKNSGRGIDSYKRYIYIHGTADENKIGQPASHGCVRMYNSDVIDLFDRVTEGTQVYIRE
jgi:hypothetical protein